MSAEYSEALVNAHLRKTRGEELLKKTNQERERVEEEKFQEELRVRNELKKIHDTAANERRKLLNDLKPGQYLFDLIYDALNNDDVICAEMLERISKGWNVVAKGSHGLGIESVKDHFKNPRIFEENSIKTADIIEEYYNTGIIKRKICEGVFKDTYLVANLHYYTEMVLIFPIPACDFQITIESSPPSIFAPVKNFFLNVKHFSMTKIYAFFGIN